MKIGIITFHRALNYGAFLQSYALQEFFRLNGFEVEFIDFSPYDHFIGKMWKRIPIVRELLDSFRKHRHKIKLQHFYAYKKISDYLFLSNKYETIEELKKFPPVCDIYICGSDQIWNPDYIQSKGLFDATDAYFLSFGSLNVKRIAYAASIGKACLNENFIRRIIPHLINFYWIGVREKAAKSILGENGIESDLVCDPTLLHSVQFYQNLLPNYDKQDKRIFIYTINHKLPVLIKTELSSLDYEQVSVNLKKDHIIPSVFQWLSLVANSGFVITTSYHCVIFCLLFKTPFIFLSLHCNSQETSNRLISLLEPLNLKERIINSSQIDNSFSIKNYMNKDIFDWENIHNILEKQRIFSKHLLLCSVSQQVCDPNYMEN